MKRSQLKESLPIFLVLFLGYFGYGMGLPIYPPLLFDPELGMLPHTQSLWERNILMGLLTAMYPLGQMIGGPLLGRLSDRYGRRRVLLYSVTLVIPGYILSGIAINLSNVSLFFFSRWISGLFEGIIVIATAAMADISSSHKDKVSNFGWIVTISGSGVIFGPLIGGFLADSSITSWFNFATPFYLAAFFSFICLLLVYWLFEESLKKRDTSKLDPKKFFSSLFSCIKVPDLQLVYFANFKYYLCIFFFLSFFPVLLVQLFGFSAAQLGLYEGYLSIPICISPFFYRLISHYLSPRQTAALGGVVFFLSIILILLIDSPGWLYFTLIPPGFAVAIGFSYTVLMISDRVGENIQGAALGTNQSVLVAAEALAGIFGGILSGAWVKLPLIVGGVFALSAAFWLLWRVLDPPSSTADV